MYEQVQAPRFGGIAHSIAAAVAAAWLLATPPAKSEEQPAPEAPYSLEDARAKKPGIIFLAGLGGRGENWKRAQDRLASRYKTHLFSYPEKDGRVGNLTLGEIQDAFEDTYRAFLLDPEVDPKDVTVAGYSLGAYIAAMFAEKADSVRVVLQALPSYPDGLVDRTKPIREIYGTPLYGDVKAARLRGETDSRLMQMLANANVHILCISHGNDRTTPPSIITKHCAPGEKMSITEIGTATHLLSEPEKEELADIVERWLENPRAFVRPQK